MSDTFTVKRAYGESCVRIGGVFKAQGYHCPSISAKIDCEISTDEARALATALIAEADRADAADKKRADAKARREAWRAREIAAGRMVSMSPADFLRRA